MERAGAWSAVKAGQIPGLWVLKKFDGGWVVRTDSEANKFRHFRTNFLISSNGGSAQYFLQNPGVWEHGAFKQVSKNLFNDYVRNNSGRDEDRRNDPASAARFDRSIAKMRFVGKWSSNILHTLYSFSLPIFRAPSSAFGRGGAGAFSRVAATTVETQHVGRFTLTRTVANHADDIIKRGKYKGQLARPYLSSPHTIENIMKGGKPIADPGGISGALRWDVPGTFRGSQGIWQLVAHPETNMIYHFNFVR
jgi:hypothetical protein